MVSGRRSYKFHKFLSSAINDEKIIMYSDALQYPYLEECGLGSPRARLTSTAHDPVRLSIPHTRADSWHSQLTPLYFFLKFPFLPPQTLVRYINWKCNFTHRSIKTTPSTRRDVR